MARCKPIFTGSRKKKLTPFLNASSAAPNVVIT